MNAWAAALLCVVGCGGASKPVAVWTGKQTLDQAGYMVDIGDVGRSDGLPGILVTAPNATAAVTLRGGACVLSASSPPGVLDDVADARINSTTDDILAAEFGIWGSLVGDVSGDGVGDIAVTGDDETGAKEVGVHLYLGPLPRDTRADSPWAKLNFDGSLVNAWVTAACGDVTGDGVTDLCVGGKGSIYSVDTRTVVFPGPLSAGAFSWDDAPIALVGGLTEGVGEVIAGDTDLDGDGTAELLIGAVQRESDTGGVYVVSRPQLGALSVADFPLWRGEPIGGEAGLGLATGGDLDGDGRDDFFAGAAVAPAGRGYAVTSPDGGDLADAFATFDGHNGTDWFGFDAAIGDLDGDGDADLAVGIPGTFSNARGQVAVWRGPVESGEHALDSADLLFAGSHRHDLFGRSLAAGDVDGDGVDDLVVGAPEDSSGDLELAGAAYLYLGSELPWK